MKILITGGAGFIGSNFIKYILSTSTHTIINLDALTYSGHLTNLDTVHENNLYTFVHGDICDQELVREIFHRYDIDVVINFAAESHVDRSIKNPEVFLNTNILGTHNLLKIAKEYWEFNVPQGNTKQYKENVRFLQISTDEVYGSLGEEGFFTEESCISPNSPYSASKASADLLVRAYHETYGLPILITRCSNNYGPKQFAEKFIPNMILHAIKGERLPLYGDGKQVRDWLHVNDHCAAISMVLHKGKNGEVYNIGGNNEKDNIDVAKLILRILGKSENLIEFVQDRLGHDRRYAIDNTKIMKELGWAPSYTFEQGLESTIQWYMENLEWANNHIGKLIETEV